MVDKNEFMEAVDRLSKEIIHFYSVIEPDSYLNSWVLISHKLSPEWEQQGTSAVGMLTPADQSFVTTRGLLEIALDEQRL